MFKIKSFTKKTLTKITLSLLVISLGLAQTCIINAGKDGNSSQNTSTDSTGTENTGLFGSICSGVCTGAKYAYDGVNYAFNSAASFCYSIDKGLEKAKRIARYTRYAAYGLGAIISYFAVLKPTCNFMFGKKGKTATSIVDFGLKWSFVAAIIAVPICAFLYFNNKLNKISQDIKDTKRELAQNINDRADKTDTKLENFERNVNNQHEAVMQETVVNGQGIREIKNILLNRQSQANDPKKLTLTQKNLSQEKQELFKGAEDEQEK